MAVSPNLYEPPDDINKLKVNDDINRMIKALECQDDAVVRRNGAKALGEIVDSRIIDPLIIALKDPDIEVRRVAALSLGNIGNVRAVDPLRVLLKDGDKRIRKAATEALGKIGAPAFDPLISALDILDEEIIWAAAEALGKIGDARAVEPLLSVSQRKWGIKGMFKRVAIEALVKIGNPAIDPLIATFTKGNRDVRDSAVLALGDIGPPAVARLNAILIDTDKDKDERKSAAEILDKLGWQPDLGMDGASYWVAKKNWEKCVIIGAAAVDPLNLALKSEDKVVRQAAAKALGEIGDSRAVDPLIIALKSENQEVAWAAAEALGKIGDARAIDPLIAQITYSWTRHYRSEDTGSNDDQSDAIAKALGKIGLPAVTRLTAFLYDKDKDKRKAAAIGLKKIYHSGQLDQLAKNQILNMEMVMAQRHFDNITGSSSDCSSTTHNDTGIGINL